MGMYKHGLKSIIHISVSEYTLETLSENIAQLKASFRYNSLYLEANFSNYSPGYINHEKQNIVKFSGLK